MLTTFDLDEYVFAALRAGRERVPAQGHAAGRPARRHPGGGGRRRAAVARRHPAADRGVRPPPATPGTPAAASLDGLTEREREVLAPGRPRAVQRRDRAAPLRQPGDREDPRGPAADEAGRPRPGPAHRHRLRVRPGDPAGLVENPPRSWSCGCPYADFVQHSCQPQLQDRGGVYSSSRLCSSRSSSSSSSRSRRGLFDVHRPEELRIVVRRGRPAARGGPVALARSRQRPAEDEVRDWAEQRDQQDHEHPQRPWQVRTRSADSTLMRASTRRTSCTAARKTNSRTMSQ